MNTQRTDGRSVTEALPNPAQPAPAMIGLPHPEEFSPNLTKRYVYGIQSGQFIKVGVSLSIPNRLKEMRALKLSALHRG